MAIDLLYEVAIGLIPGIGSSLTRQLVSYCGSAESVFRQTKGKLKKIPGIGEILANTIIDQNILEAAEHEIKLAEKNDTELLFYTHKKYPQRLKQIHDAPTLLYFKGNADLNVNRTVGIVGTREATLYGKEMVEKILLQLQKYEVTIISGLAYGIDITAHKHALKNNQPNIGVMASGMDIIYPAVHKETAKKMLSNGGLLTEYKFGSKPDAPRFPARNRIIAGLCDAIIVAEAAEKGGALITAEIANSYDREVFAIPGNIGNKYSEGCNKLIRNHKAHILTDLKDMEYIMNWDIEKREDNKNFIASYQDISALSIDEQCIVSLMKETDSMLIDDLSWKSQIPMSQMASLLLNLEFQGLIKSLPGKRYKLN